MFGRTLLLLAGLTFSTMAVADAPTRVRGTIASVNGASLDVTSSEGAALILTLAPEVIVTLCEPATLAEVKPGSFIGAAARTQSDGTLVAIEIHMFPEAMRGAGEGHRAFDLGPKSTMTNGTVGEEVVGTSGRTLTVHYKGGEKAILVPPDAPVVAFAPGDRALLTAGAHIIAFTHAGPAGVLMADRVVVGKDGLVPPM